MSRHSPKEIERIKRVAAKMTVENPAEGSLAAPTLLGHVRPTTEEVNAEWDAMRQARRDCPKLDYYYKLWNKRADLYRRIDLLTERMKGLAAEVPPEYRRHL